MDADDLRFDEHGLVACVIQDWTTGEVLTVAYSNEEAVARTRATGEVHLWSRSRQELWHKGATSGHTQRVRSARVDCDGDALLYLVEPAGPACHTGARSCFFRTADFEPLAEDGARAPHEVLADLERTIAERAATGGGWTGKLLESGPGGLAGEKVQEEAEEVARAAREESDERVANEAADVLYHLAVLLRTRGLSLRDAEEVLLARRG